MLLSEGYHRRGIPLARLIDAVTRTPDAHVRAVAAQGRDRDRRNADFAIVDLDGRQTVRVAEQRTGAEYSIYEGWELTGAVEHTVLRGRFVVRDREVVAHDGGGRFQPRHRSGAAALREARLQVPA